MKKKKSFVFRNPIEYILILALLRRTCTGRFSPHDEDLKDSGRKVPYIPNLGPAW
jgi:hypothetical protein